ncbi:MAG: hypothetical protein ACLP01_21040 [Solirubrobacteraceae bacterium]
MTRTVRAALRAAALVPAVALAACGSAQQATGPTPPAPVNESVYVENRAVSVSPESIGAGPVALLIADESSGVLSLSIARSGPGGELPVASSAPIRAGSTSTLTVDLRPGRYLLAAGAAGGSQALIGSARSIAPASLLVGPPRATGDSTLLSP